MSYRYTATAWHVDGWWVVQCDQWPGAVSQVKRLDRATDEHREAVAFVADVPADEIELDVRPELSLEVSDELERAAHLIDQANTDLERASSMRRDVARRLAVEDGLSVRDIGTVLGVSYQRAHQLVRS